EDFEQKMKRVVREIASVLELPQAIEEERKYIVELTAAIPDSTESDITQTYLVADPGCEIRLRRRSTNGNIANIHTTRKRLSTNEELVTERQVTNALYESLLQQADPYRRTIHKRRNSFIYQGQFFELDTYLDELEGLIILETKGIASHADLKLPPFLRIVKDITGDVSYYNPNLALRK
ncbi:MAG: AAA family ATPase, partial [Bacteroidales bacterium]|nr:AAA family ATPase [Bacteroidales bacterium]